MISALAFYFTKDWSRPQCNGKQQAEPDDPLLCVNSQSRNLFELAGQRPGQCEIRCFGH